MAAKKPVTKAAKKAPAKPKPGRPSSYRADFAAKAERLCQLGATDKELGDFFEVDVRTIHRWKADHEQFCHALKAGKAVADDRVERSLFQKAVGYEQDAVKIFMPARAKEPVYAPYREKIAPDTTAAIFWLKNRRPAEWRDKVVVENETPPEVLAETAQRFVEVMEQARERQRRVLIERGILPADEA